MPSLPTPVRAGATARWDTLGRRAQWWVTWALLFAVTALWSISGPLFSGPDEPSHVIKAAAVVRGQLLGTDRLYEFGHDGGPVRDVTMVRVPEIFIDGHRMPACYAFKPDVPAGCSEVFTGSETVIDVPTFAGHYQPLYYALVGFPSLVFQSAKGVSLMRLFGSALIAALLASALASAFASRRPALLVLGTCISVTPMVLYLGSVVNPSGLEVASALCVWVSALVLLADLGGSGDGRLVARIGVAGALLAFSRGLSPLWLVVIGVVALAAARRGTLATLVRRRDVRICALGLAAAVAVAAAWLVFAGTLETREPPLEATTSVTEQLRLSLGDTDANVREMVGSFGWLDVEAPALVRYLWLGGAVATVLGAFAVGRRRYVVALALLLAVVVVVPVVLETLQAPKLGRFWQGRYTLPLAVGIPPLAALAIADRVRLPSDVLSRLAAVVLGTLAVGQVLAYAVVTRRYTVGVSGPIMYVLDDGGWRPPVPAWLLLPAFVLAVGALAVWLHRLVVRPPAAGTEPGPDDPVPEPAHPPAPQLRD